MSESRSDRRRAQRFEIPSARSQGAVLFHPERPEWVYLNATAREILDLWERTPPPRRSLEVARLLSRRHRQPLSQASTDVRAVLSDLKRRGFLGPPSKPLRRAPVLQSLQLHLTERCNLACLHCHFSASPAKTLDLPVAKALDLVSESASLGSRLLILSGGEPLLHPGLKRIMRAASRKMEVQLATNGTLIDDAWADFLAALRPEIQISLDGPDAPTHDAVRGRGAFSAAMAAINRLAKRGLAGKLILSTAMQSDNLDRLDDVIALAERLGVAKLRFLPLRRGGRARRNWARVGSRLDREAYERFYDRVLAYNGRRLPSPRLDVSCGLSGYVPYRENWPGEGDFWCFVGTTLAIAADGNAYPCVLMMEPELLLGNIHRQSLDRLMRGRPMARACRLLAERRQAISRCAACAWGNLCQAGCMGNALDQKGTVLAVDRFCGYRRKLYRAAFEKVIRHASG